MTEHKPFYPEPSPDSHFPSIEENIIQLWQEKGSFTQSVSNRDGNKEFIFYDGPPFANGLPHYGHLLTGFVKDIVARYQTMRGAKVERRFGWDCHGLPAEMGAEKELGISGRHAIVEHGIDKFNDTCRSSVMKFAGAWEKYVNRQARWVDFTNDYKTMDTDYMESVLWAFKELYNKGLVYESLRVMPYSWACQTPLSNFETRMDNAYRERADKAVTVAFDIKDAGKLAGDLTSYRILAWTTTPWTLPSNLALAVGPEMDYVIVNKEGVGYIIAEFALKSYAPELGLEKDNLPSLPTIKGSELAGLPYEPLLPYFADHPNAFKVLEGEFVIQGDGTGIVHLAPGFGEDDMAVCQANDISVVCPVDNGGCFTAHVPEFEGVQVFDANDDIIKKLKEQGSWIKTEQYLHNYPHCWRTDTPLIYKAVPSWYVKVSQFKDRMVELNQQINWIPNHIKDGQFGKWLENARDWSISRNRFWGSPIPVWKSDNPDNDELYVFGSIKELEAFFDVEVKDLHRPFIDELTKEDPHDSKYTISRVEDVFDCWFESGSMPFAQVHYPFENQEWFEHHFPADFIVEYIAQTRGWFYTLMVLSTALFDRPPFKNCICHGVVLDDKGQKLSKRLNNYADPMDIFNKFGADAMRWVMVSAPIMHGGELLIDKEGNMIRDAVRLVIKPVYNAYNFFALYANADDIKASFIEDAAHPMDQYILAKCKGAVESIQQALDAYDLPSACGYVEEFYEVLNNWYIRRSKERFWKEGRDDDKQAAYDTLYTVQHVMVRALSPLLPLLSEDIWQNLHARDVDSVHLQDYPDVTGWQSQEKLLTAMDRVRDVCNTALSIRNQEQIRVRQPLERLTVVAKHAQDLEAFEAIIKDEINIKSIAYQEDVTAFADYNLKIHFPVLGKRLPQKMKQIIPACKQGKWTRNQDGTIAIEDEVLQKDEYELQLLPKEAKGAQSLSSNDALVILDLTISQNLKREGIARDMVRLIQQSRKDADLHVSDRIDLYIQAANNEISLAIADFNDYIAKQTLATSIKTNDVANCNHQFAQTLEGDELMIGFNVSAS